MSPELIAIIGAPIALAAVILPSLHAMRRDIAGLHSNIAGIHRDIAEVHRDIAGVHRDVADLRERMARLEGLFEGLHPPRVRTAPARRVAACTPPYGPNPARPRQKNRPDCCSAPYGALRALQGRVRLGEDDAGRLSTRFRPCAQRTYRGDKTANGRRGERPGPTPHFDPQLAEMRM